MSLVGLFLVELEVFELGDGRVDLVLPGEGESGRGESRRRKKGRGAKRG